MSGFSVPEYCFLYQGLPAASGTLNVYQTSTTTPVTIYSDGLLTTPISNPLTLDGNGCAKFYVSGAVNLRLDAYTQSGALIQSIDPVYPVGGTTTGTVTYAASNFTLSSTQNGLNFISTAPITISLPLTTTLNPAFSVQLNAQGGAIILAPNVADKVNQGSAGATFTLASGTSAELWTDGAGNWGLNFASLGTTAASINAVLKAVLTVKRQTFTASGTFTPDAGMIYCDIELWAGGGGGGGVNTTNGALGGGGGAGGYSKALVTAATIGASQVVTIGTGGTAGANTGGDGGTGGTTSVGAVLTAAGGVGGKGTTSSTAQGLGGTGGAGTYNGVATQGMDGGIGTNSYTNNNSYTSGIGGSTLLGGGGKALLSSSSQAGIAGVANSGGGGSGAASTGTGELGGVGGSGLVTITEYCTQ